jgi:acetyl esterase/lipase
MTLSRKAIRPAQSAFLLANGVLPVSLDFRLCPEVSFIDGAMVDVRDAYAWAQEELPHLMRSNNIALDTSRIAVIGWSTGGHLAMTTGWTLQDAGLSSPKVILSFYSPTDFESGGMCLVIMSDRTDCLRSWSRLGWPSKGRVPAKFDDDESNY